MSMKIFRLAGTVLKSLSRPPATRLYPFVPRVYETKTRGHIDIEIEKCILCGICDRRCPTQAISVTKAERNWSIERLRCIQCSSCVELCPTKCLSMGTQYTGPSFGSVRDSFTQAPKPEGAKSAAPAKESAAPGAPAAPVAPAPKPADDARVSGDA
jgi:ech hydrogenase subunit F